MDADGSNRKLLDRAPQGFAYAPTWSPDGTKLAYMRSIGEVNGIFVIDLASSQERQISPEGVAPEWSPDGSRLAFVAPNGLALMHPDGTDVTSLGVRGDCPTWSPDGDELAYCAMEGEFTEETDLYVTSVDGSESRQADRGSRHRGSGGLVARRRADRVLLAPNDRRGHVPDRRRRPRRRAAHRRSRRPGGERLAAGRADRHRELLARSRAGRLVPGRPGRRRHATPAAARRCARPDSRGCREEARSAVEISSCAAAPCSARAR